MSESKAGDVSAEDVAVKFDSVSFAYDRNVQLPDEEDTVGYDADPDSRSGAVLRNVNLNIPDGSFTVVMGASGGGKSTLVRCLNAVVPKHYRGAFRGRIDVLGREASDSKIAQMAPITGMVMQNYEAQLFGTTIESEIAFGPENLNVDREQIGGRIDHALSLVDLDGVNRRRPPTDLSGGQKQRLVFASVLAMHPELLILDEPTSDLDPRGTRDILGVIRRLADKRADSTDANVDWAGPETFVLVTHKIEEAILADHVVLLRGGSPFRAGPAEEVFTDVEALREARVAVPPLVETFDRLGVPQSKLPIATDDAVQFVRNSSLEWTPPGIRGDNLANPTNTGENVGEVLFEVEGLSKRYSTDRETVVAVDDVDLTIREGEFIAIVGHNGSGKTTLAKHLNGLIGAEEGAVSYRGTDISDYSMSEIGQEIGYVFQNPDHQLFASTVREELEFGPRNFGMEGGELEDQVQRAIDTVDLGQLVDADPFNLSKGQRQRVALGSILATDPSIIIFDEPTTGLDAPQAKQFMDLVARLNRKEGVTVVMVTHGMQTVATYAPRTVVMSDGSLASDTRTRELFADEDRLREYELLQPQQVELSNRLAADPGALPALSIGELVTGLGGPGAYREGS
jgi:energy-coupling factor transport system ATP-binding protein